MGITKKSPNIEIQEKTASLDNINLIYSYKTTKPVCGFWQFFFTNIIFPYQFGIYG